MLLLSEDNLDIGWWGSIALHSTVGLVDSPVSEHLTPVALDVSDNKLFPVHFWGDTSEGVLDELDEELAGLLWPAGGWGTPLLALSVVGNTLVITEEWDGALVADDSLEVFEGLVSGHALDSVTDLEHWLEVDALLNSLSLKALHVGLETVILTHRGKAWPNRTNR